MAPAEQNSVPLPPPDEELRYGPGIVQRLKSRYLDLARKQATERRRPSLRRAASLDLLDEPSEPRAPPTRTARPINRAQLVDLRPDIKRARSVDALSRLDTQRTIRIHGDDSSRDTSDSEVGISFAPPTAPPPPPPVSFTPRTRKPVRASPLLSEAERPPQDLVKSTRRLFESAPRKPNPTPSGRVATVVRGLQRPPLPSRPRLLPSSPTPPASPASPAPLEHPFSPNFHTSTPEPRVLRPTPPPPPPLHHEPDTKISNGDIDDNDCPINTPPPIPAVKPVSKSALDNISRAGQTLHFSFESVEKKSHLPVAASNPVTISRVLAKRPVGVIRPIPPPPPSPPREVKSVVVSVVDAVEVKLVSEVILADSTDSVKCADKYVIAKEVECVVKVKDSPPQVNGLKAAANKPRWSSANGNSANTNTSMVFNFSNRKDVPDYIENDGMIMKVSKKDKYKPGDPGVVVLSSPPLSDDDSSDDSSSEDWGDGGWSVPCPPELCRVRFTNDNVLCNGRSSLLASGNTSTRKYNRLKIQFDDSLTRTFEYPSEASLIEDDLDSTQPQANSPTSNPLGNSPIVNSSLSSYTPSKIRLQPDAFQLGVTRSSPLTNGNANKSNGEATTNGNGHDRDPPTNHLDEDHYLKPCQDGDSLNWSQETNQGSGDLLF